MMTIRCYLAPSSIEGLGVFAAEPLRQGSVAWRYDPRFDLTFPKDILFTQPPHVQEFLERYTYVHHENLDLLVLDGDEGRFMNHAEQPNLDFSGPLVGVAVRDIAAYEELTCDYTQFTAGPVIHQPPRHRVQLQG